jgi:hypothetical protein
MRTFAPAHARRPHAAHGRTARAGSWGRLGRTPGWGPSARAGSLASHTRRAALHPRALEGASAHFLTNCRPLGRRQPVDATTALPAARRRVARVFRGVSGSSTEARLQRSPTARPRGSPGVPCPFLAIPRKAERAFRSAHRFWADLPCDPISARAPATRVAGWRGSGRELMHTSSRVSGARKLRFRGVTRASSRRRGGICV